MKRIFIIFGIVITPRRGGCSSCEKLRQTCNLTQNIIRIYNP